MARTYTPLAFREGRVEVTIERFPYLKTGHTYRFVCGACGRHGFHASRQKFAIDDAYDHMTTEHLRLMHPES